MYIILCYDIDVKRVGKVLKTCRRYLHWVQNSVLEGELTGLEYQQLKDELNDIISNNDNVRVYSVRAEKWMKTEILGDSSVNTSSFL
ncbi:CRISPR-associated endonuclease Cas2 [Flammeovirga sp. EKP202]|uniref:CRISPR-associated endonuclease Cas2 n=1 Tax=Flammeovirga sp. EKP202 TaxID=2770592 RepID=UPI00165F038B|nr:CRISPR-associated endonuclease Cas2 [Flammeovirga sp. EKP202]MBD0405059.1 CRISPR-associated endonuclease Cas2 [Flammeovirga sp. EKP202]